MAVDRPSLHAVDMCAAAAAGTEPLNPCCIACIGTVAGDGMLCHVLALQSAKCWDFRHSMRHH